MELNLKWPTLQFKLRLSFCPRKQVTVHSYPLPRLASWIKLSVPLPCYRIQEIAMGSGSILINSSPAIVDLKNLLTRIYLDTPCTWFYFAILSSVLKVYTHREFDSLKSKSTWTCRYYFFFFKIKRVQNLGDWHRTYFWPTWAYLHEETTWNRALHRERVNWSVEFFQSARRAILWYFGGCAWFTSHWGNWWAQWTVWEWE